MTTKDRLLKYIAHTGLATSRFESLCGLSNGYVRNLKSQIGEDKLSTILKSKKNGGYLISNELHHILEVSEHYRKRMEKK